MKVGIVGCGLVGSLVNKKNQEMNSYKRRRWLRAPSLIEKETLKKRISNIE